MRCGTARALLPLLLDKALPPAEHHEVAEHFDACPSCAQLRAVHEVPPPPLPPIPDCILAQFGRDLDEALNEELALREALKRRSNFGCIQLSRAWMWVYLALLGTTTSVAVYGLAHLQYNPSGLTTAAIVERAGLMSAPLVTPAALSSPPGAVSDSSAFLPCAPVDDEDYLEDRPSRPSWLAPRSASSSRYIQTASAVTGVSGAPRPQ